MKVLMTNHSLMQRGGSESYLETVSTELRRLGHEVVFYSPRVGKLGGRLRENGYQVLDDPADLPGDVDVIHGQHADAVAWVRTRLPRTPMVFASHSWFLNVVEDPAPELGANAIVVFNRLTHDRMSAHLASRGVPLVRMTQPVSLSYADNLRVPIAEVPRRAVAVSRRMRALPARLAAACADLGIEFDWVGADGHDSADARREMYAADIVIGMGRSALEGMAAGRAVLVADESVVAGWVDEQSYPGLEDDGFTGWGSPRPRSVADLLTGYEQDLGATARRLMARHHSAQLHAVALVELYTSVADQRAESWDPRTLALLVDDRHALEERAVRAEWATAQRDRDAALEVAALRAELVATGRGFEQALAEIAQLREEARTLRAQRDKLRRQRDRLRRRRADAQPPAPRSRTLLERVRSAVRRLRK
jgi:hypothetical protein